MEELTSNSSKSEIHNTKSDDLPPCKHNDNNELKHVNELPPTSTEEQISKKSLDAHLFKEVTDFSENSKCNVESKPCSSNSNLDDTPAENSMIDSLNHDDQRKICLESIYPESFKRQKLELFGKATGPFFFEVDDDLVTKPLIAKNLPAAFNGLPLQGRPEGGESKEDFFNKKLKDFVSSGLTDLDFEKLSNYCSVENLKTGYELIMPTKIPLLGLCSAAQNLQPEGNTYGELNVNKRYRMKEDPDDVRFLKYRGARLVAPPVEEGEPAADEQLLEPGKDLIYRVRVYRPFPSASYKNARVRHSLCQCDVVVCARLPLCALRERMVCSNDLDMRLDVAAAPHAPAAAATAATAREVFPSGFFFISNVFYVDRREGRRDLTVELRQWARDRGLGDFPVRDMDVPICDVKIRLGHPDVYIHQGNCEHLFVFSSVRVATALEPLRLSSYPYSTIMSANQTIYCTTCAEFGAKWIVTGSNRVPFDPAFFCDTCFKLYMYKDGKKIGDFKAFSYRGNEINLLKAVIE